MIAYLKGKIQRIEKGGVVLLCGQVGYLVHVPARLLARLTPESEAEFLIVTIVREDAITLFGFEESEELELFGLLVGVSGVGPKTALNLISGSPVKTLKKAIVAGDLTVLTSVPGIGKKSAARIIIELRKKLGGEDSIEMSEEDKEVENVLVNWGFGRNEIRAVLKTIDRTLATEEQIKTALKYLNTK